MNVVLLEGSKVGSDLRKRAGALHRVNFNLALSITGATGHDTRLPLRFVKRLR